GNASATANASSFSSSKRALSRWQNGQSGLTESLIVLSDALLTDGPKLRQVCRIQLPPESRLAADTRKVPLIPQGTTTLELLEGHAKHHPLDCRVVEAVYPRHSGNGLFYRKVSLLACLIEPTKLDYHVGQSRAPMGVYAVQQRKQQYGLVRGRHV